MASTTRVRIEYTPLAKVQGAPRNPKLHDLGAIRRSIERFGFVLPLVMDERSGRLVAGHGRLEALVRMKGDGAPPPKRIATKGKDWMVPIVRGAEFANEADAEAYLVADNKTVELGGWDDRVLAEILRDTDAQLRALTGVTEAEYRRLQAKLVDAKGERGDGDAATQLPVEIRTRPGDLWVLGNNRLLCGDSTRPEDVQRLLAGARPLMMVTDPPYGVEYDPEWRVRYDQERGLLKGSVHSTGKVENDDRIDWTAAYKLFPGDIAYVWHAGLHAGLVGDNLRAVGFDLRNQIIWAKQHFVFGRGAYHWKHEPCWYAVRTGSNAVWAGDRSQTTVWDIQNRSSFGGQTEDDNTNHGTQKPLECMARAIRNHGQPGDGVYDPFCGSGTTLIAAEQLERRGYGIEIMPVYCDVIVQRWQKFTGGAAIREIDGVPFNSATPTA